MKLITNVDQIKNGIIVIRKPDGEEGAPYKVETPVSGGQGDVKLYPVGQPKSAVGFTIERPYHLDKWKRDMVNDGYWYVDDTKSGSPLH